MRSFVLVACVLLGLVTAHGQNRTVRLVQATDFEYLGAFRLPTGSTTETQFDYGGTALAYRDGGSLFLVGHDWHQKVAEVDIPEVRRDVPVEALAVAPVRQPLTDILEGRRGEIGPHTAKIGGLLPQGDRLVVSAYLYYDGAGEQRLSHFVRDIDFARTGEVKGPIQVGDWAGIVSGSMTMIPAEWQSALGGPALTGQCCLGVISRTSFGPSASVFDPAMLDRGRSVGTTVVVGYPQTHPTLGAWDSTGTLFNGATTVTGMVLPADTGSLLFFGRRGLGQFCYGAGTWDRSKQGQPVPDEPGATYCHDPEDGNKGVHAYPYAAAVWAYDVRDLAGVKNGRRRPWDIKPYATWTIEFPYPSRAINGVAYDPATRRFFISTSYADDTRPLIQVMRLRTNQ